MRHGDTEYEFVKNILGDVIAIVKAGRIVAHYEYDAWCNHKVYNSNLSMSRKITDSIIDVSFSIGGFFAAMGAEALVGSIGRPVGTVLGATAGLGVGVAIWCFQTYSPLYNEMKIGFNNFITQTIPNAWDNFVNGWNNFGSFGWAR